MSIRPYINKKTGKVVSYRVQYYPVGATHSTERSFKTKAEAERFELEHKLRKHSGDHTDLAERQAFASAPLREHMRAFTAKISQREPGAKYIKETTRCIWGFLHSAGINRIDDITADKLIEHHNRLRKGEISPYAEEDRKPAKGRGTPYAPSMCNGVIRAVKEFSKWAYDTNRTSKNRLAVVKLMPAKEVKRKRTYKRRTLWAEELDTLLSVTLMRPSLERFGSYAPNPELPLGKDGLPLYGLPGVAVEDRQRANDEGEFRAFCYLFIYHTTLRPSEILRLEARDIHLKNPRPNEMSNFVAHIFVREEITKNHEERRIGIHAELVEPLARLIKGKAPRDLLFSRGARGFPTNEDFKRDLALARIPSVTEEGVVDLYSLKHAKVTHLVNAGTGLEAARQLAGHTKAAQTATYALQTPVVSSTPGGVDPLKAVRDRRDAERASSGALPHTP